MHLKDEGLEHILTDLEKILSEAGIEKIEAEGRIFDENLHEAIEIEHASDEAREGTISEVLQMGWRFKDGPVIRPAKVKVYKIKQ